MALPLASMIEKPVNLLADRRSMALAIRWKSPRFRRRTPGAVEAPSSWFELGQA
jgi:hypothetical protein